MRNPEVACDSQTSRSPLPDRGFLGVSHSVRGRFWQLASADTHTVSSLLRHSEMPEVMARAMAVRDIGEADVKDYLAPTVRDLLPNPSSLQDMDAAVERIVQAILSDEAIAVFGDYDVDGATSTALLIRYMRQVGKDVDIHIPDRITEGYGPNAPAVEALRARGADLLITVDCGVTSFAAISAARRAGLDVVILDHHQVEDSLPEAVAVVNPKRTDDTSGVDYLAAVGVVFLLLVGLNRSLRTKGYFSSDRPEPNLMQLLDLVAFGTVCDVVPLKGVNRAFVTQGLKILAEGRNPGLTALINITAIKPPLGTYHIGFVMGPRINAGGRVGQSDLGARLLSCDDPDQAAMLAEELEQNNLARRDIEATALREAIAQVEQTMPPDCRALVAAGENWHPGVVGLVASRLKERFNIPSCAVTFMGGQGKGSGRSVDGVNLGAAILAAREAGVLVTGGGHAMAAGFTVERENLSKLCSFLSDHVKQQAGQEKPLVPVTVDGAIDIHAAGPDLVESLSRMEPFGAGNDEPRFAVPSVRIGRADVVGNNHIRAFAFGSNGGRLKLIAFRAVETDLGRALLNHRDRQMHLLGALRADNWNGRRGVQFVVEDAAFVDADQS